MLMKSDGSPQTTDPLSLRSTLEVYHTVTPMNPYVINVLVYLGGALSGWTASKLLLAYLWTKKRDSLLRFLDTNSARFGYTLPEEGTTSKKQS
jgi:hypothetical protein